MWLSINSAPDDTLVVWYTRKWGLVLGCFRQNQERMNGEVFPIWWGGEWASLIDYNDEQTYPRAWAPVPHGEPPDVI